MLPTKSSQFIVNGNIFIECKNSYMTFQTTLSFVLSETER